MQINTNLIALNTKNQLKKTNQTTSNIMEKLSSGKRINKAADDAAGLAISQKMRAQIRGLDQANENVQDGVSLIQTAEGALNEMEAVTQRMRELSVQGANDTLTTEDREKIQKELDALKEQIDLIGNTTEFNTRKLLNGDIQAENNIEKKTEVTTETKSISKSIDSNIPIDGSLLSTSIPIEGSSFNLEFGNYYNSTSNNKSIILNQNFSIPNDGSILRKEIDIEENLIGLNLNKEIVEVTESKNFNQTKSVKFPKDVDGSSTYFTTFIEGEKIYVNFSDNRWGREHRIDVKYFDGMDMNLIGEGDQGKQYYQTEIEWSHPLTIEGGTTFHSIDRLENGNFIVSGFSTNSNIYDTIVAEFAADGNLIRSKHIDMSDGETSRSIKAISDGYILTGSFKNSSGDYDQFALKLSEDFTTQWKTILSGNDDDHAYSIKEISSGEIILTGYTSSTSGEFETNGNWDLTVAKLSSGGDKIWTNNYGGEGFDRGFDIIEDNNGDLLAVGLSSISSGYDAIDVSNNYGNYDGWGIKIDSEDGKIISDSNFGGTKVDKIKKIEKTNDGGYIMIGETKSSDHDLSNNYGDYDVWVMKFDNSDQLEWSKNFGGSDYDSGMSIKQTDDDGYIFLARSKSEDYDVSDNYYGWDFWAVKLDRDGEIDWDKNLGGNGYDSPFDIVETSDGYVAVGNTWSDSYDLSGIEKAWNGWAVKLKKAFNVNSTKTMELNLEPYSIVTDEKEIVFDEINVSYKNATLEEFSSLEIDYTLSSNQTTGVNIKFDDHLKEHFSVNNGNTISPNLDNIDLSDNEFIEFNTFDINFTDNTFSEVDEINIDYDIKSNEKTGVNLNFDSIISDHETVQKDPITNDYTSEYIIDKDLTDNQSIHINSVAVNYTDSSLNSVKNIKVDYEVENIETINKQNDNSLKLQVGANTDQTMKISIKDMRSEALGMTNGYPKVIPRENAEISIKISDTAIRKLSNERARLGAKQNRLEHVSKNLINTSENLQSTESRIEDADMAKQAIKLAKNDILIQASQYMLSQANVIPQSILELIK